jgi:hypothetical protein
MPAAQLGVGGYGQVALDAGSGFPIRPVGHHTIEYGYTALGSHL